MKKKGISRRDLLSIRFGRRNNDPDQISALESDFTTEMLFHQMIKMGKDPASMSRDDMLRVVSEKLKK
ncbi:MAG: hypothetical protein R6W81_04390 [Bacteroidales bacterium]